MISASHTNTHTHTHIYIYKQIQTLKTQSLKAALDMKSHKVAGRTAITFVQKELGLQDISNLAISFS